MKASKNQSQGQSKLKNTATKLNKNNNKKYISSALEKYLDDKIKITDEDLFMNNVEKIQNIINNTKEIKNFKDLSSIPNTTKNSNRKQQKFTQNSNSITIQKNGKEKFSNENDSEITFSDYDDLKRDLEIKINSQKNKKNNCDFTEKEISDLSKILKKLNILIKLSF